MHEKPIIVQCEFNPDGKPVSEIIKESFILFLHRTFANPQGKAVEYPR